jgi:hypothetical protein
LRTGALDAVRLLLDVSVTLAIDLQREMLVRGAAGFTTLAFGVPKLSHQIDPHRYGITRLSSSFSGRPRRARRAPSHAAFGHQIVKVLLSVLVLFGSVAVAFTLTSPTIALGWKPAAKLEPRALTRLTETLVAAPVMVLFITTLGWLFRVIVKVTSDSVI